MSNLKEAIEEIELVLLNNKSDDVKEVYLRNAIRFIEEGDKPIIPEFIANWIEEFYLQGSNPLKVYNELDNDFVNGWTTEEDAEVYHWIRKNSDDFIDSLRNGYYVEVTK